MSDDPISFGEKHQGRLVKERSWFIDNGWNDVLSLYLRRFPGNVTELEQIFRFFVSFSLFCPFLGQKDDAR